MPTGNDNGPSHLQRTNGNRVAHNQKPPKPLDNERVEVYLTDLRSLLSQ